MNSHFTNDNLNENAICLSIFIIEFSLKKMVIVILLQHVFNILVCSVVKPTHVAIYHTQTWSKLIILYVMIVIYVISNENGVWQDVFYISSNTKLKLKFLVMKCDIFVYNLCCRILCLWITKHYNKNCVDNGHNMTSNGISTCVCVAIILVPTLLALIASLANTIHEYLILFHHVIKHLAFWLISARMTILKWLLLIGFDLKMFIVINYNIISSQRSPMNQHTELYCNYNCILMDELQSHYNLIFHYIFIVLSRMILNGFVLEYFINTDKIFDEMYGYYQSLQSTVNQIDQLTVVKVISKGLSSKQV